MDFCGLKRFLNATTIFFDKTLSDYFLSCRAFHRFGRAKLAYDGLVLGLSQFSILSLLPQELMLDSKVVKKTQK
jgi:hypothetical protein